jgi:hypothetical protein
MINASKLIMLGCGSCLSDRMIFISLQSALIRAAVVCCQRKSEEQNGLTHLIANAVD